MTVGTRAATKQRDAAARAQSCQCMASFSQRDRMNEIVIGHIDEIDVGWLNAVLHRARAVITGEVSNFTAEPLQSVNARHAAIRVEYEPGSTGTLPRCLLLK